MNYKGLVEKKNDLITRAEAILSDAEQAKRELTDDEAQELAEIRDDVKKIKEALEIHDEIKEEKKELKEEDVNEAACEEENDRRAFEAYVRGVVLNERTNMTKAANCALLISDLEIRVRVPARKPSSSIFAIVPTLLVRSTNSLA